MYSDYTPIYFKKIAPCGIEPNTSKGITKQLSQNFKQNTEHFLI